MARVGSDSSWRVARNSAPVAISMASDEGFEIINPEPPRSDVIQATTQVTRSYNPSHQKLALANLRKSFAFQMKSNGKKKKEAQNIEWAYKTIEERFEHLVQRRLDARTLFNQCFVLKFIKFAC